MNAIKRWLLKQELKKSDFTFSKNQIRIIGVRFLTQEEVAVVENWYIEGKIKTVGVNSITSTATGITYTDIIYRYGAT